MYLQRILWVYKQLNIYNRSSNIRTSLYVDHSKVQSALLCEGVGEMLKRGRETCSSLKESIGMCTCIYRWAYVYVKCWKKNVYKHDIDSLHICVYIYECFNIWLIFHFDFLDGALVTLIGDTTTAKNSMTQSCTYLQGHLGSTNSQVEVTLKTLQVCI